MLNAIIPAEKRGAAFSSGIFLGIGNAQSALTWICVLKPPKSGKYVKLFFEFLQYC